MIYMNFDIFSNLFNCNLQTFDLDVFWFEHPLFNSNKITKEDDFSLDLVDISYSNARTLCSYHLTRKELYFISGVYFLFFGLLFIQNIFKTERMNYLETKLNRIEKQIKYLEYSEIHYNIIN